MKISDIHECLERMAEIYQFEENETDLKLARDPRCCPECTENRVIINTWDREHDVYITLETSTRTEVDKLL